VRIRVIPTIQCVQERHLYEHRVNQSSHTAVTYTPPREKSKKPLFLLFRRLKSTTESGETLVNSRGGHGHAHSACTAGIFAREAHQVRARYLRYIREGSNCGAYPWTVYTVQYGSAVDPFQLPPSSPPVLRASGKHLVRPEWGRGDITPRGDDA
jgi:hypothetical protein